MSLLDLTAQVLSDDAFFFLLNSYTTGLSGRGDGISAGRYGRAWPGGPGLGVRNRTSGSGFRFFATLRVHCCMGTLT